MRVHPPPGSRKARSILSAAFTLIEITLALATLAFVITAIVGLLSHMAKVARESVDDTILTAMVTNVAEDLRGRPFNQIPNDITGTPSSITRYFYEDGSLCEAGSDAGALEKRAVYKCEITGTADPETLTEPDIVNLVTLHLNFTWPLKASNPASSYTVHFDLARYH